MTRNSWTSISLTNALAIALRRHRCEDRSGGSDKPGHQRHIPLQRDADQREHHLQLRELQLLCVHSRPNSSASRASLVVPKIMLTTSAVSFQIADESNYKSFNLSYSGSLVTLSMGNGNGQINRVFGVN